MKTFTVIILSLLLATCTQQQKTNSENKTSKMDSTKHKYTNALIEETSPYLLQHAHNPVNWLPWGKEALNKAKKENKPLLISIGYSACHWCHVMEHESFEDEEVAQVMNEKFVCIKIDREERPDIDNIYMSAVHLMGQRGGWPLNCFAMPDGKPFYGGTYFPKSNWIQLLNTLSDEYKNNPEKVLEYATKLTDGIKQSDFIEKVDDTSKFNMEVAETAVERIRKHFDLEDGGANHAPKFPIPNNYDFLLQYYYHTKDKSILDFVELTLKKMAYGGIYDQIGGGFARYSVDAYWKVPHFEKMLYDNAQLVSLYSNAYKLTKNPLYKNVVFETIEFIKSELTSSEGFFYSALDADSEGVEGKYYVWQKNELQLLLEKKHDVFASYYNVNQKGFWEHGNYILLRDEDDDTIAQKHQLTIQELNSIINECKNILTKERSKRVKPGLDDKSLTSWNALMITGLVDAYTAFGEDKFLKLATKNADLILGKQLDKNGQLNHSYKEGKSTINGYLEDYSFTIEALINLYQATLEEKWLNEANNLTTYTIKHFYNHQNSLFYFTREDADDIIARKMEIGDNVIPASNSSMAKSLFLLGKYFNNSKYEQIAFQMLKNVEADLPKYVFSYSNWAILLLNQSNNFYEVAITGNEANAKLDELNKHYIPNKLVVGSKKESNLPLLKGKFANDKTMIYVCFNKACQKPVSEISETLEQLN